jgi:hypothetical protein
MALLCSSYAGPARIPRSNSSTRQPAHDRCYPVLSSTVAPGACVLIASMPFSALAFVS